jgi:hypothetical protein
VVSRIKGKNLCVRELLYISCRYIFFQGYLLKIEWNQSIISSLISVGRISRGVGGGRWDAMPFSMIVNFQLIYSLGA